jgi:hypothetical protein
MGAGLLTFVSTDLNTVTEQNRGQRAFEVADAGIQAAKHQLATNVDRTKYDGDGAGNCVNDVNESQWSALRCADPKGLTLTNLATTSDSANVTIRYIGCAGCATDYFRVISTGTYGDPPRQSKRRIEAVFNGVQAGTGGGTTVGHPLYYTPTNIKIMSTGNNNVKLNQVSLFSLRDILIQSLPTTQHNCGGQSIDAPGLTPTEIRQRFTDDMEDASNPCSEVINRAGGADELCNWNSANPSPGCFTNGAQGNWNNYSRAIIDPGLGAGGKICSFTSTSTNSCPSTAVSIADGRNSFDGTGSTSPVFKARLCQLANTQCDTNQEPNTISPPFPLPKPKPAGLKAQACHPDEVSLAKCTDLNPSTVSYYDCQDYLQCAIPDPSWGLGNANSSSKNKVAFIDARNRTVNLTGGKGIVVVWCGHLVMTDAFEGIILNLVSTGYDLSGTLSVNTNCSTSTTTVGDPIGTPTTTVGTYENQGYKCACWVYSEGGSSFTPGIQIDAGSTLAKRESADWNFQSSLFSAPPPTDFRLQNWRELYQASP